MKNKIRFKYLKTKHSRALICFLVALLITLPTFLYSKGGVWLLDTIFFIITALYSILGFWLWGVFLRSILGTLIFQIKYLRLNSKSLLVIFAACCSSFACPSTVAYCFPHHVTEVLMSGNLKTLLLEHPNFEIYSTFSAILEDTTNQDLQLGITPANARDCVVNIKTVGPNSLNKYVTFNTLLLDSRLDSPDDALPEGPVQAIGFTGKSGTGQGNERFNIRVEDLKYTTFEVQRISQGSEQ